MYGVIKDADAYVRFSFFTGVSKFSKVSLFSGLNNLIDITLEPEFSAICGYTDRDLDTVFSPELDLPSTFDVDDIATEALLFQTGYLTITGEAELGGKPLYRLGYPNREVRQSLQESLLRHLVGDATRQTANTVRLNELLGTKDFDGLRTLIQAFFSSIPHEWYTKNDTADYEGYCASVFYSYFASLELDITVEDSTSHGRLDMAVRFGSDVYLFEFKVVEMAPKGTAMAQLKEKRYADKYRDGSGTVFLVGVEFSKATRNVVASRWRRGDPPGGGRRHS